MGERVRLGGISALFQTCHSSVKSSGGGVRGQLWPEVIGKSITSGRLHSCMHVCVWMYVLPYCRDKTSGTSEQSGGCCQGHRSGRSNPPPPACPQPFSFLLPTVHLPAPTMPALPAPMQHHDWVLLAADRWAFTWNHSLRQEKRCERLCCVEVVPGRGAAWKERKGLKGGRGGLNVSLPPPR